MSPSVSARLLLTQSDARLVAFARAGHERAFEALVRRYRGPLLGYCRRLLLSEERAEDALQQALMQAWLALRADTEVQNARAWLYRIVHNSALNALRVSGYDYCTLSESLSGADAPQADLDRRIAVREALAGLAALPEMQREALLRTAVEGSSHCEAARELGVSEPALRGLVYRARATLRAAAGAFVPGPVLSWALGAGSGAPLGARVAEVGVGGGGASVAGLLMKGGAMAVTAGVLAGGIAAVHAPRGSRVEHRARASVHRQAHVGSRPILLASARTASERPAAYVRRTVAPPQAPADARRPRRRVGSLRRGRHDAPLGGGAPPVDVPAAPKPGGGGGNRTGPRDGGGDRTGSRDGGGDSPGGPRAPGTVGSGAGGDGRGGEGGHGGGDRGSGGPDARSEGEIAGEGPRGGTSDGGRVGGGDGGSGGGDRGERSGASGDGEARERDGATESTSSTRATVTRKTNASSGGGSTAVEGGQGTDAGAGGGGGS